MGDLMRNIWADFGNVYLRQTNSGEVDKVPTATVRAFRKRIEYPINRNWPWSETTMWQVQTMAANWHWHNWPSPMMALAEAESHGYVVSEYGYDRNGYERILLIHPATQAALEKIMADEAAKWANAKPCFVRYGKLPKDGHSRNHADGTMEAGVSVFRGERLPNGEARPLLRTNQELGSMLFLRLERDLYIVTGEEIGLGSDGEPVLRNARIWRKAKTAEA